MSIVSRADLSVTLSQHQSREALAHVIDAAALLETTDIVAAAKLLNEVLRHCSAQECSPECAQELRRVFIRLHAAHQYLDGSEYVDGAVVRHMSTMLDKRIDASFEIVGIAPDESLQLLREHWLRDSLMALSACLQFPELFMDERTEILFEQIQTVIDAPAEVRRALEDHAEWFEAAADPSVSVGPDLVQWLRRARLVTRLVPPDTAGLPSLNAAISRTEAVVY